MSLLRFDLKLDEWVITTTPDVTMRLKRIFPRMAQEKATELRLKATDEIANELEWVRMRYPMETEPASAARLATAAKRHRDKQAALDALVSAPPNYSAFKLAIPLRDYQALGTALYLASGALLLADEVGLGKSGAAIASLTDPRTLPALVVVKAHLTKQWVEEVRKFLPELRCHIIKKGTPYPLPLAHVYVITYSKLSGWWGALAGKVRSVIYDEIQELRVRTSQKYHAAKMLNETVAFRIGLSATPIYNYGGEVWNVVSLLSPDALGSFDEFAREWCRMAGNGKWIVNDPEALGHYLRKLKIILRRTRAEVGRVLPPIVRYVQDCEFDEAIYRKGTSAADELARIMLSGSFIQRGAASREFELQVRQSTGVAKAPYVAELIRMLVESGEKVLVGAWHRAVHDVFADRLKDLKPVFFTGEESPAAKDRAKNAFISGDAKILVMSLRSGDGTNGFQDVCSCCVIAEFDWAPAVVSQLIGRLARDGQKSSVQVFIPVAPVGSDPIMASVLGLKAAQADGIVDLGSSASAGLTQADPNRLKQLAIDYLKSRGLAIPQPAPQELETVSA